MGKGLDFTERNQLLWADPYEYVFVTHAKQCDFLAGAYMNGFEHLQESRAFVAHLHVFHATQQPEHATQKQQYQYKAAAKP